MSSEPVPAVDTRKVPAPVSAPPASARRPRRGFGLLARISLSLIAVGLLPLAVVSFWLIGMNREAMTEQVLRTHAVAAQTTAARVEAFLRARRYPAQVAAMSTLLQTDPLSPQSTALLSDLLSAAEGMTAVAVRNGAGEEVVRAQRREQAAAMEEVLESPRGAEMTVVDTGGGSWLRIELPLWGGPDQEQGRLQVVCDLLPLLTELRPAELGDQAEMVIVDTERRRVAGAADVLADIPEEMLAVATSGRVSGSGRFSDLTDLERAFLGAYAPIDGTDWIVLSRQPADVAEAIGERMRQRSMTALTLALSLVLGLVLVARRSIVEPLRSLIREHRRLAGTAERPTAAGSEIEQLKETFALLERRLRDRQALGELFLGRYRVESVVGEGAMGSVFRGWDPTLERPVAIKTVRFDRWRESDREELTTRLLEEAVTVARFSHPNIVALYDIQESPEVAYLTMEYVDGESLERRLDARGRLLPAEVVRIGAAIASGLEAAHRRGIVHHDIKPANVLLGPDGAVKVVDFGVSQVITPGAEREESVFGTPGFIPPESLRGEPHGPVGDLFALGVTLYVMLTGEIPFYGDSLQETLKRTLLASPPSPDELTGGIPAGLTQLVMNLLEKDPDRRCPSAAEAGRRLARLAAELGVEPPSPTAPSETDLELERTGKLSPAEPAAAPGSEGWPPSSKLLAGATVSLT